MKKVLLLAVVLLSGCSDGPANGPLCRDKENCINDSKCLCWCSQICNFRKKVSADSPVYVENDPNGKFCYCKQWDIDQYKNNCILKKNIKEPTHP